MIIPKNEAVPLPIEPQTPSPFGALQLPSALSQALKAMKFVTPTPVQAQAIPVALEGQDLIACAQTGTGKTAAFGIPLVSCLLENPQQTALVLVPTRELALQVSEVLKELSRFAPGIRTALVMGGTAMPQQIRALAAKPRVIIATPGRLCDHLQRKTLSLANTGVLVLDEADRMLDMGFAPQLSQILRFVPKERQTLLFSATLPANIEALAKQLMRNPQRVSIGAVSKPAEKISQSTVQAAVGSKNDVLLDQINAREGSIIVFARTKSRTDRVARYLSQYGLAVTRIHGDRTQGQRTSAIEGFRAGRFRILVATDIAARGLDIPHIAHVINYDLPQVAEDYVHRIGRTGRAGAEGQAVSILLPEDKVQWDVIQRLLNKGPQAGSGQGSAPGPRGGSQPGSRGGKRPPSRNQNRHRRGTRGSSGPKKA